MEGVTELQGDGIDVGNLAYCQGRVKMSTEPTCSRRKSLCLSIVCQSGTEAGKRRGSLETLAALPNEQKPFTVSQRELSKRQRRRRRLDCENGPPAGESEPATSFDLLTRLHHPSRHRGVSVSLHNI